MRHVLLFALLSSNLLGCEFKENVGEDLGAPCDGFQPPEFIDCTAKNPNCDLSIQCPSPMACNEMTGRCFFSTSRCVGTPCIFDGHCAGNEACNMNTRMCFNISEQQTCMPCLWDSDCGRSPCEGGRCK